MTSILCRPSSVDRKLMFIVVRHPVIILYIGVASVVVSVVFVTVRVRTSSGLLPVVLPSPEVAGKRHVTLCNSIPMMSVRRTGNHLFMLAAAIYLADRTNRTVAMPSNGWPLDDTFQTDDIVRYRDSYPCPCRVLRPWPRYFFHGDQRLDTERGLNELRRSGRRTLALCGLYQTFRYADRIAPVLRQLLRFRAAVRREADEFLVGSRPAGWKSESYVRVGVHVRRGDFLSARWIELGTTVVDERYIEHVVDWFVSRNRRVQFVVTTDDIQWTRNTFDRILSANGTATFSADSRMSSNPRRSRDTASVIFSEGRSAGVDLAILSSCDAVAVSTGSFGWWAAWLAKKTTVYYADWPRPQSQMSKLFTASLYWPPSWIPLR